MAKREKGVRGGNGWVGKGMRRYRWRGKGVNRRNRWWPLHVAVILWLDWGFWEKQRWSRRTVEEEDEREAVGERLRGSRGVFQEKTLHDPCLSDCLDVFLFIWQLSLFAAFASNMFGVHAEIQLKNHTQVEYGTSVSLVSGGARILCVGGRTRKWNY